MTETMTITPTPWHVEAHPTQYPDLFTYDVLGVNPETGQAGACYQGKYFAVATELDSPADAALIAAAPELLAALRVLMETSGNMLEAFRTYRPGAGYAVQQAISMAAAAIEKSEAR